MAEDTSTTTKATEVATNSSATTRSPKAKARSNGSLATSKPARSIQQRRSPAQIYKLPAPIRTFPLPAFHPTNPLSLAILVSTWLGQVVYPPCEPSVIYDGVWYPETGSVNVLDHKSIRALWEQGFYGKGNLSRSEPHWLERQKVKTGLTKKLSSENYTSQRREARQQMKWERAKAQQEAIEETRRLEALEQQKASIEKGTILSTTSKPPVGPMEILALPNSSREESARRSSSSHEAAPVLAAAGSTEEEALPAPVLERPAPTENGHSQATNGTAVPNGVLKIPPRGPISDSGASDDSKSLKRQKSVRFSPKVEATTFNLSDPPNPNAIVPPLWSRAVSGAADWISGLLPSHAAPAPKRKAAPVVEIDDIEHLQLTPEEAFFLAFAFGALRILDPSTKDLIPLERVFSLFRRHASFPVRPAGDSESRSDDPFLLHYVVYHHFRSLGWCVRPGIKFGVDWLLYLRGPVFNHAEFGVLVLPSYSDEWWESSGQEMPPQKSWNWLCGIGRTLSQVYKSLVLVYVDIPPTPVFEKALRAKGFAAAFGLFRVREVMMSRWLHNRNRSVENGPSAKAGS